MEWRCQKNHDHQIKIKLFSLLTFWIFTTERKGKSCMISNLIALNVSGIVSYLAYLDIRMLIARNTAKKNNHYQS
jgi:hypothetical protein